MRARPQADADQSAGLWSASNRSVLSVAPRGQKLADRPTFTAVGEPGVRLELLWANG